MIAVLTTLFLSLLCSYHIAFIWPPRFWIKSVRRQISLATLRQANGPSQPYHLGGMQWWWLMVVRMCDNRLNIIIDDKNKRPRGRPRARWIYNITNDERRRKTRRSKVSRGGCQILTRSVNLKLLMIMMMHILKRETAKIKRWTNRTDNFLNSPRLLFSVMWYMNVIRMIVWKRSDLFESCDMIYVLYRPSDPIQFIFCWKYVINMKIYLDFRSIE